MPLNASQKRFLPHCFYSIQYITIHYTMINDEYQLNSFTSFHSTFVSLIGSSFTANRELSCHVNSISVVTITESQRAVLGIAKPGNALQLLSRNYRENPSRDLYTNTLIVHHLKTVGKYISYFKVHYLF